MENNLILTKENPIRRANFISKLTFWWFVGVCSKCSKNNLRLEDLYAVLRDDKSSLLTDRLEKNWKREISEAGLKNKNPSLFKAIKKTFFWIYMFYGVLLCIGIAILKPIQPALLAVFIQLFSVNSEGKQLKEKCIYGGLILLENFLSIFFIYNSYFFQNIIGMRVRVACSSLVYRKILRLSPKALQESAAGEVINLLANDANRFDIVAMYPHYIWITPILVIIGCVFIWYEIGISGIIALIAMLLVMFPINVICGRSMGKCRLKVAEKSDQRINKMAEIVSGIQIIKMYAWEKPFAEIVNKIRIEEADRLKGASYSRAFISSSWFYLTKLSLFITVVIYVLMGNTITAAQVFSMTQIFYILQVSIGIQFPYATSIGGETLTSIERLKKFLLLEEKYDPGIVNDSSNNGEVALKKVTASWVPANPTLTNISFHIPKGSLCAIVGQVGAGKSSLLQLLLGELVQEKGTIMVGGEVSYSSQSAWIFSTTVQKNILFGQTYDRHRYRKVVKVCSLRKDFEQFPQGDESLVGEKGTSLSGGQKARINLARAVYRDADIYFLDDPLSAVDTNVGKELFQNCIQGYLGMKTRILVTHQLQYLKEVDHIIILNQGGIEAQGTFTELSNINIDFSKLLVKVDEQSKPVVKHVRKVSGNFDSSIDSSSMISTVSTSVPINKESENEEKFSTPDTSIYWSFVKSGAGWCSLILFLILLILSQIFNTSCDLWVTYWTSHTTLWYTDSQVDRSYITHIAIYIYLVIIVCFIIFSITNTFHFYIICLNASKTLHNRMFSSLLEVPMRFFETNPSGRILSRFSRDIGIIDELLPRLFIGAIQIVVFCIASFLVIIFTNPYTIIVIVVICIIVNKLKNTFITVSRNIKHLEGIAKSPVFTHINATWNGLTTIRAMKMQSQLQHEFDLHQDTHTSPWHLSLALLGAFQVWTDLISLCFVAFVIIAFIVLDHFIVVNSSLVGLALNQALLLMEVIHFGIIQTTQAVNQFTCVERVLEYTKLDKEESSDETLSEIPLLWPYQGSIKFSEVSLRYSFNDPPVLKGLNFFIKYGEKIGIVGRTGAGKSSLLSALFLLTPIEGTILIDGIDTKRVGLRQLRSAISVIPQEPVLFSGSLRYNLDPFDHYLDEEIWKALDDVELKNVAPSLDFVVQEGGCNFSVGQRQLMCMARAILRKNKILVLDEATANVDSQTDELIQKTIRTKFTECTVLTVAHRLNTIMDSDRVIVLNGGLIVEFDHAHKLLENQTGSFSKLVAEADSVYLKAVAENSYKTKTATNK